MSKTCIYHSRDLDGWMSAAIVKSIYPDITLLGWDYSDTYVPDFAPGVDLIIVDLCFDKEHMIKFRDNNNLTWIDHHKSSITQMDGVDIKGLRSTEYAACELSWVYFMPKKYMPELVRALGRYDCFGHKGTHEERTILEFQYGARQLIRNVDEAYNALQDDIHVCASIGLVGTYIYDYLCVEAQSIYKQRFEINLNGLRVACVNRERFNPINFGINYHNDGYDCFACFWYVNGQYVYSLYNDDGKVDCSVIAKSLGGGGHAGAAGFQLKEILK